MTPAPPQRRRYLRILECAALFFYRYHRTCSLLAVALERALWGDLVFTLGIGWHLYSGSIR